MIQPSSNGSSRVSYGRIPDMLPVAELIETQIRSFNWFKREGLRELFGCSKRSTRSPTTPARTTSSNSWTTSSASPSSTRKSAATAT